MIVSYHISEDTREKSEYELAQYKKEIEENTSKLFDITILGTTRAKEKGKYKIIMISKQEIRRKYTE